MKKIALSLFASAMMVAIPTLARADDHHHHPVCHNVKDHGHWHKVCR